MDNQKFITIPYDVWERDYKDFEASLAELKQFKEARAYGYDQVNIEKEAIRALIKEGTLVAHSFDTKYYGATVYGTSKTYDIFNNYFQSIPKFLRWVFGIKPFPIDGKSQ